MDDSQIKNDQRRERISLYIVIIIVMILMSLTIYFTLTQSSSQYEKGIDLAANGRVFDSMMILVTCKSMDQSVLQFIAIALGFCIALIGCLFVLSGIQANYKLLLSEKSYRSSLETTSPGLVLITLGLIVVSINLFVKHESTFELSFPEIASNHSEEKPSPQKTVDKQQKKPLLSVFGWNNEPYLLRARMSAGEASIQGRMRSIAGAQMDYNNLNKNSYANSISELVLGDYLSPDMTGGKFQGYEFAVNADNTAAPPHWSASCWPINYGVGGVRSFYIDESGVLRADDIGGAKGGVAMRMLE